MVGCAEQPPRLEVALAREAVVWAKEAGGEVSHPILLQRAEDYLKRSEDSLKQGFYSDARRYANEARNLAERVEELSVQR